MKFKQRISIDYFVEQIGVTEATVKNRAKSIFNKSFYHLSEAEKIELLTVFIYEYHKDMPRITLRSIADVAVNIGYLCMTAKMLEIQDCIKKGAIHEIREIMPDAELFKLLNILYTERFGKTVEDEFKDTFRPELLMFKDDFVTKRKIELEKMDGNKLDGEPGTGA